MSSVEPVTDSNNSAKRERSSAAAPPLSVLRVPNADAGDKLCAFEMI